MGGRERRALMRYQGRDSLAAAKKNASFPFACTSKYKVSVSRGNISLLLLLLPNTPLKVLLGRFGLVW